MLEKNVSRLQYFLGSGPLLLACLTLIFTPLIYFGDAVDTSGIPRYAVISFVSLSMFIIWLIHQWNKTTPIKYHPFMSLVLVYSCWAGMSYFWSIDPVNSLQNLVFLVSFLLFAFVIAQTSTTTERIQTIILCVVISGTIVAIIGLLQTYGFNPLDYRQSKPPAATFLNKNHAAQFMDFVVPLSFAAILFVKKNRWQFLLGIGAGINLAYLILTGTRGSWLGLTVALLTLIYVLFKHYDFRSVIFIEAKRSIRPLLVALVIPLVLVSLPNQLSHRGLDDQFNVGHSAGMRLKAYANALPMIADNPATGVGIGGFMLGFRPYTVSTTPLFEVTENKYLVNLHNDFLQEFTELGIPGGLLFIAIYLWLLLLAWRNIADSENKTAFINLGILLALIVFGTHALFSFAMHRPSSTLAFWLLAGLIVAMQPDSFGVKKTYIRIAAVILVPLGIAGIYFLAGYYPKILTDNKDLYTLVSYIKAKNCDEAIKLANQIDLHAKLESRIYIPLAYNICGSSASNSEIKTKMDQILAYDPNSSIARVTRGMVLLDQEKPQSAAKDFLNVVKVLPHQPTAYQGLGHAALKMGDIPLAREMYEKALSVDENFTAAKEMLQKLNNTANLQPD